MRIVYIGNFDYMWDEEHVARCFEKLGHEVMRVPEKKPMGVIVPAILEFKPDFVLWAKLRVGRPSEIIRICKENNIKTVCWIWDLYFGYQREHQIKNNNMFKADLVFTSDDGHEEDWKEHGIAHKCIRQGIYDEEAVLLPTEEKEHDVVFVGSENPLNEDRTKLFKDFDFKWFGKKDTNEVRGMRLNELYTKTKIVIGDSVYSPHYWSNRVVETLGRGGFLIHQEVEGLKEAYPHLVTYKRGDYKDLKEKIAYYLGNDKEREEIIKKNYEWVLDNHLCSLKCKELCKNL